VMAPGALDPLTKELIYVAVSVTNGCIPTASPHIPHPCMLYSSAFF